MRMTMVNPIDDRPEEIDPFNSTGNKKARSPKMAKGKKKKGKKGKKKGIPAGLKAWMKKNRKKGRGGKKKIHPKKSHPKKAKAARKSHPKKKKGASKKKRISGSSAFYKFSAGKLRLAHARKIKGTLVNPLVSNPHKKRHKKGAKHMKKFWKNPVGMVKKSVDEVVSILPDTLWAGAGYISTNIVTNMIPFEEVKYNPVMRIPTKIAASIVLSVVANMVNKSAGKYVLLGGMLNAVQDTIDTTNLHKFLPMIQSPHMQGYIEDSKVITENAGHELLQEHEAQTIFNTENTGSTIFE